ncbi:MAG: LacI family DNA-binding transcriptional regulator [Pseudomonadota bacterium]
MTNGEALSKKVTIKSIARDLGISHMTVSRALSDHPNVQRDTRAAVHKRAAELGYVKSAAAQVMRGEKTQIIGLLLPNIVNAFYARLANAMAVGAQARSMQLIIHLTDDQRSAERLAVQRLREVQARAIAMVPAPGEEDTAPPSFGAERVVQLIRQRSFDVPAAAVLVDDTAAIHDAVGALRMRGHSSIAYLGGSQSLSSGRNRLAAFRSGLATAGLDEVDELVRTGAPSHAFGWDSARAVLAQTSATAMVCGGFEISNGALEAVMAAKSKRAMELIGYGDPPFYRWLGGGVSAIRVPVDELADKALDLALAPTPQAVSFPAELVMRSRADGSAPRCWQCTRTK